MSDDKFLKGLDDIRSNNVQRCAYCGIPITSDNDSGWEVFVDEGKHTQPVCAWCDAKMSMNEMPLKKADSEK